MKSELLLDRYLKADSCLQVVKNSFCKEYQEGWSMDTHSHKELEIIFGLKGSNYFSFGSDVIKVPENGILLIAPDTNHRMYNGSHAVSKLSVVQVDMSYINQDAILQDTEIFPEYVILKHFPYLLIEKADEIGEYVNAIVKEISEKEDEYEISVKCNLVNLMIMIARNINKIWDVNSDITNRYVLRVIEFINNNINKKIIVNDLAKSINISADYLMHTFKRMTGKTIIQYANDKKMEKAKSLLIETDTSIQDISGAIGMDTVQYFSTLFKKETGLTPNQFRQIGKAVEI